MDLIISEAIERLSLIKYCQTKTIRLVHPNLAKSIRPGRKEMFYLTTHSTHFIYDYMASAYQTTTGVTKAVVCVIILYLYYLNCPLPCVTPYKP